MKKRIHLLWNSFCMITTCILTAVMLFTNVLFPEDSISPDTSWQILLVSLLCTASTTLLYPENRILKKAEFRILVGIHYLIINAIVLGFGSLFDWYRISSLKSTLIMLSTIAIIFIAVSVVSWMQSAKESKRMNERLEEYQHSGAVAKIDE